MRGLPLALLLLLVLAAPGAAAASRTSPPGFEEHVVPVTSSPVVPRDPSTAASEPTLGIPWNTDSVFYHTNSNTYRARFDASGKPAWLDVTPPYQVPINLDPMLIADSDTGRIFAGGLHGACSVMMLSDDDGATWTNSGNMCSGSNFDHQSVGSGRPAGALPRADPTYPNVAYYCAQGGKISCARSADGGRTWLPFQEVAGSCGGFHGHIRVSPKTGFVAVPVADCGERHGYLATTDGGLTWTSNELPFQENWTNGFDPSLQFTRPSGWMYYAMASERGVHVALTKDEGKSWEVLGTKSNASAAWLDLGALHDPPVVAGVFTNVQAGDDDRVAVAFFGLEAGPGADRKFLTSNKIYRCDARQEELVWRAYVATSFDAGQTWTVRRVTDDPVQVGGVYDVVVSGPGNCRNLLDFNDVDIDSKGRLYWGIGDGCIDECAKSPKPNTTGWRKDAPRVWRQVNGTGLFAKHDGVMPASAFVEGPQGSASPAPPGPNGDRVPGPGLAAGLGALGLAAWRRGRRQGA